MCQEIIMVIVFSFEVVCTDFKKANKQAQGKLIILQPIGIIVLKSKETRAVTYACRYSSGYY